MREAHPNLIELAEAEAQATTTHAFPPSLSQIVVQFVGKEDEDPHSTPGLLLKRFVATVAHWHRLYETEAVVLLPSLPIARFNDSQVQEYDRVLYAAFERDWERITVGGEANWMS